jgi:two-component system cell cycle sensor histidine kinase/response regulator CckA
VEDEEQVRDVTRRFLEDEGFAVRTARHGVEALEVLARDAKLVQVVVSDVLMPQMDGLTLARRIRTEWPALKIILTSGHLTHLPGLPEHVDADIFLPKPFDFTDLLTAIRRTLVT